MTTTPTPPDHFPDATKMIAALEDDVKPIRDALADYSQWAGRPTVLENALAHIDAQAVRLDAAERLAADRLEQMQADRKQALVWRDQVKTLLGTRKVLWNLLGECLPLLHQIESHDAESDERLGFLIGQIEAARSQVQAEELPGRI